MGLKISAHEEIKSSESSISWWMVNQEPNTVLATNVSAKDPEKNVDKDERGTKVLVELERDLKEEKEDLDKERKEGIEMKEKEGIKVREEEIIKDF